MYLTDRKHTSNSTFQIQNHYIYLLIEREFINVHEPVYKLGRTTQEHNKRMCQYPKSSILIFQMLCHDCVKIEADLIRQFKIKYKHRPDIGNEYFQGHCELMIKDIYEKVYTSFLKVKFFQKSKPETCHFQELEREFILMSDSESEPDQDQDQLQNMTTQSNQNQEQVQLDPETQKQLILVREMLKILKLSHPEDEGAIVPYFYVDEFEIYYTENQDTFLSAFSESLSGQENNIIEVINLLLSLCGNCKLQKTTLTKYTLTSAQTCLDEKFQESLSIGPKNFYDKLQSYRYQASNHNFQKLPAF